MLGAVVFVCLLAGNGAATAEEKSPPPRVREFTAQTLFGRSITFYEEGYRPENGWPLTILHVWGPWCVPCVREFPSFVDFAARNDARKEGGFSITAISVNSSKEELYNFLKYLKTVEDRKPDGVFMVIGSEDSTVFAGDYFRVDVFPTTLFVDAQKNIVKRVQGVVDWDHPQTEAAMEAFRQGKPIPDLPR